MLLTYIYIKLVLNLDLLYCLNLMQFMNPNHLRRTLSQMVASRLITCISNFCKILFKKKKKVSAKYLIGSLNTYPSPCTVATFCMHVGSLAWHDGTHISPSPHMIWFSPIVVLAAPRSYLHLLPLFSSTHPFSFNSHLYLYLISHFFLSITLLLSSSFYQLWRSSI